MNGDVQMVLIADLSYYQVVVITILYFIVVRQWLVVIFLFFVYFLSGLKQYRTIEQMCSDAHSIILTNSLKNTGLNLSKQTVVTHNYKSALYENHNSVFISYRLTFG